MHFLLLLFLAIICVLYLAGVISIPLLVKMFCIAVVIWVVLLLL